MSKLTDEEFINKANWEGGLLPAVFGYGLSADDLKDDSQLKPYIGVLDSFKESIYNIEEFYAGLAEELGIDEY